MYSLGIDIGYTSIKMALIDNNDALIYHKYLLHRGDTINTLKEAIQDILKSFTNKEITYGAITGSGFKFLEIKKSIEFINNITAIIEGTTKVNENAESIIEIGGQRATFITKFRSADKSHIKISMNGNCSAGTGSFLEEQVSRLNLSLEDYSTYIERAKSIPRIAGRCSVFAKTDIIHHQQEGKSIEDILLGLCYAVVRNYKNSVVKNLTIKKPIVFIGAVANNKGIIKALNEILELKEGDLIIPAHFDIIGAIGAAIISRRNKKKIDLEKLIEDIDTNVYKNNNILSELLPFGSEDSKDKHIDSLIQNKATPVKCYLGIDVGSTSINLALIDDRDDIIAHSYLMTLGKPIDVVKEGLKDIKRQIGNNVEVLGVGTTGSGRYMIGDFIGSDIIIDEITSQAKAAVTIDDTVDTVFEIGGQDSKYIRIKDGIVVDFEMNKICAAGTGSFLNEQAIKLNIPLEDFGDLALISKTPLDLGERCTVFIETSIADHLAKGARIEDIVAGLCYSIAKNYLNRVVGTKEIGKKIFFQGGVAYNQGVINAFRALIGDRIYIPPFFSVTGAFGSAIIAKEEMQSKTTKFRGFNIDNMKYSIKDFRCKRCSNMCLVKTIQFEGATPKFYGARCDIFEREHKATIIEKDRKKDIFEAINEFYLQGYVKKLDYNKKTIGIPRVLFMHNLFPMFNIFFKELGFNVVLSKSTDEEIIELSQQYTMDETCFPIKIINGHVAWLISKGIDYLFLPSLYSIKHDISKSRENYACCYMQSVSQIINNVMDLEKKGIKLLAPLLSFKSGKYKMLKTILKLGKTLGKSRVKSIKSLLKGIKRLMAFDKEVSKLGEEIVQSLKPEEKAFVIITRPYGTVDMGLNMRIPQILMEKGYKVIPLSALPAHKHDLFKEYPNMYWPFGQKIISGAQIVKKHPNLYAIYITNHGCGPDTALAHFFREEMNGKPYLHIEADEHSSKVGVITKIEAFINSLKQKSNSKEKLKSLEDYSKSVIHKKVNIQRDLFALEKNFTLYLPNLYPYSQIFAAILLKENINTKILPMTDNLSIDIGRRITLSMEYISLTALLGDIFKELKTMNGHGNGLGLFIPTCEGSDVYGQYSRLLRTKFDINGHKDVNIISPFIEDLLLYEEKFVEKLILGLLAGDIIMIDGVEKRSQHLTSIIKAIEKNCFNLNLLEEISKNLYKNSTCNSKNKMIAVISEPLILFNDFINNFITGKIEKEGFQVLIEPLSEVMWFTWNETLENVKKKKKFKDKNHLILNLEKRLNGFRNIIHYISDILQEISPFESDLELLVKEADIHLNYYSGGFGRYRIGKLFCISKRERVDGIVMVSSLYENTGNVLNILNKGFKNNVLKPILELGFDGKQNEIDDIKLQSFLYYL